MPSHEENWGIYIDFAATVHEILSDAQAEIAEAILIDSVTPDVVEQLSKIWAKVSVAFKGFRAKSEEISKSPSITPEQLTMVGVMVKKMEESAIQTDAVLRKFFQQTGLASMLPSREEAGEGLKPH